MEKNEGRSERRMKSNFVEFLCSFFLSRLQKTSIARASVLQKSEEAIRESQTKEMGSYDVG